MLRDTLVELIEPMLASAGAHPFRARCHPSGTEYRTIDPVCLENPRPDRGGTYTTENAPSPFHAEPRQLDDLVFQGRNS